MHDLPNNSKLAPQYCVSYCQRKLRGVSSGAKPLEQTQSNFSLHFLCSQMVSDQASFPLTSGNGCFSLGFSTSDTTACTRRNYHPQNLKNKGDSTVSLTVPPPDPTFGFSNLAQLYHTLTVFTKNVFLLKEYYPLGNNDLLDLKERMKRSSVLLSSGIHMPPPVLFSLEKCIVAVLVVWIPLERRTLDLHLLLQIYRDSRIYDLPRTGLVVKIVDAKGKEG
ncbi:hypothetical protein MUK42_16190 [Musa troglodytarum]|uniref:Uncharacterized protein n=1 Tax=Musa troglodytarum TaxID=320322 RepID=A0A9E7HXP4_9LILI|nr:hypothetical protein MUK42_16190 [Musa troglodytarum]